jgi:signal transduction histidine kinase
MEISIGTQGLQALISFLCGPVLGLLYDLLAAVRTRLRFEAFTYVFDLLYCLTAACLLFLLGSVAGYGELRLFMPLIMGLGAVFYFTLLRQPGRLVSRFLIAVIVILLNCILLPLRVIMIIAKKIYIFLKKIFSYLQKWFKIRNKVFMPICNKIYASSSFPEVADENQAGKYVYYTGYNGAAGIRAGILDKNAKPPQRSRSGKRRSSNEGSEAQVRQRRS